MTIHLIGPPGRVVAFERKDSFWSAEWINDDKGIGMFFKKKKDPKTAAGRTHHVLAKKVSKHGM